MPLKYYICPNGAAVKVEQCIAHEGCVMGFRCMARPVLQELAKQRIWDGRPSTTQLLKGTYEAFLEITKDYAVVPTEEVYPLLGTKIHNRLMVDDDEHISSEMDVGDDEIGGTLDLVVDEFGQRILYDYKTSGSYKVAKALGLRFKLVEGKKICSKKTWYTDEDNKRISREAGQPALEKEWYMDKAQADHFEWSMQLNNYRIKYEKKTGKKINLILIQAIVRDGNTMVAKNRGLDKASYLIEIPLLDDVEVLAYFDVKRGALLAALAAGDWDRKCNDVETWNGRKCEAYCRVAAFCKFMKNGVKPTDEVAGDD